MGLPECLLGLWTSGRVTVELSEDVTDSDRLRAVQLLERRGRDLALELPGPPPEFDAASALEAALAVYHAARFTVFRRESPERIAEVIGGLVITPAPSASEAWSADIALRSMVGIRRRAARVSREDPLLREIDALLRRRPLSASLQGPFAESMTVDSPAVGAILDHPCLRRLLVDRMMAGRDRAGVERLGLSEDVSAAIGAWPELAPGFEDLAGPGPATAAAEKTKPGSRSAEEQP